MKHKNGKATPRKQKTFRPSGEKRVHPWGWPSASLLFAMAFWAAAFPTKRIFLNAFGVECDHAHLPFHIDVDGFQSTWAFSARNPVGDHSSQTRSEMPFKDHNFYGHELNINGSHFEKGVGAHAPARIAFNLDGKAVRFSCLAGLDKESNESQSNGIYFSVLADGKEIFRSGRRTIRSNPLPIDVPVEGIRELVLVAESPFLEDSESDVDWVELRFQGVPAVPKGERPGH